MEFQAEPAAARTALWRALHVAVDPPPHVLVDEISLKLLAPPEDWRRRQDMDPLFTKPFRASIVARARFVEDLVEDAARANVAQYVIPGAGLDTLAQRRPDLLERMRIFEVDQRGLRHGNGNG
jgi:O-methyltransferase involved in polyketide biosynthesis